MYLVNPRPHGNQQGFSIKYLLKLNTTKIVRSLKDSEHPFTRMSNTVLNLKADEVGIMFQILSNSDKWIINKNDVWKKSKLGKDRFERAWKHLKELGYIVINKTPMNDGKFGYSYIIYEIPLHKIGIGT